jgi:phosphoribosylanthranilate isomerase
VTRVKICGCRTPDQALAAAKAGADFIGIMFAESRRKVSLEDASEIVRALGKPLSELEQDQPPALFRTNSTDLHSWFEHGAAALERLLARKRPLTVGVFAGNDADEINQTADECGIDLIQLSGDEPWGACLLANRQVIKVVHVAEGEAAPSLLQRLQPGSAMAVMLEQAKSGFYGGSGTAMDWDTAGAIAGELPVWLAGGLTPENVGSAMNVARPWCVDVSTGVETDGVKDAGKIRAFIRAVKDAQR